MILTPSTLFKNYISLLFLVVKTHKSEMNNGERTIMPSNSDNHGEISASSQITQYFQNPCLTHLTPDYPSPYHYLKKKKKNDPRFSSSVTSSNSPKFSLTSCGSCPSEVLRYITLKHTFLQYSPVADFKKHKERVINLVIFNENLKNNNKKKRKYRKTKVKK